MIAIPFIDTMLNNEYRTLIQQPFNDLTITSNFKDWYSKDMVSWTKLTNMNNNVSFEFYGVGNLYKIKNPKLVNDKTLTFPYPINLDQFICDCHKSSVILKWNESIINSMNRIYFMRQTEIEKYNTELLIKIEKE